MKYEKHEIFIKNRKSNIKSYNHIYKICIIIEYKLLINSLCRKKHIKLSNISKNIDYF